MVTPFEISVHDVDDTIAPSPTFASVPGGRNSQWDGLSPDGEAAKAALAGQVIAELGPLPRTPRPEPAVGCPTGHRACRLRRRRPRESRSSSDTGPHAEPVPGARGTGRHRHRAAPRIRHPARSPLLLVEPSHFDRAVRFMIGLQPADHAESEQIRDLCRPGLAISYKIGEREIPRLGEPQRRRLGERFDLDDFHARVPGSGEMGLELLGGVVAAEFDS